MTTTLTEGPGDQHAAAGPLEAPFRRILVPLDGSPLAERALPYARTLARLLDAALILTRAARAGSTQGDPADVETPAAEAEAYLRRLADGYQAGYAVEYSVPSGDPAREIATVVKTRAADLIVMSTHGRGGLGRLLVGSVADTLVRQTTTPLLLVGPRLAGRTWEAGLRRILVPLDGSPAAEAILPRAAALARAANAQLTLLRVVPQLPSGFAAYDIVYLPADDSVLVDQAHADLERLAAPLRRGGLAVETQIRAGSPAEWVASTAAAGGFDLVAMATHAPTGLDRFLFGSVTAAVVRTAEIPVLVVRGE